MYLEKLYDINLPLVLSMIIIVMPIWMFAINFGLELCKKNIWGILILTITLNIIGTFIGCMIIYKSQHLEFRFLKSFWNKIKKIFNWKIKFKRKPKQNNISPQS